MKDNLDMEKGLIPPKKVKHKGIYSIDKIFDLILSGQEKAAKKAFSEGQKKGIFDTKEHFKDIVAKAKCVDRPLLVT